MKKGLKDPKDANNTSFEKGYYGTYHHSSISFSFILDFLVRLERNYLKPKLRQFYSGFVSVFGLGFSSFFLVLVLVSTLASLFGTISF